MKFYHITTKSQENSGIFRQNCGILWKDWRTNLANTWQQCCGVAAMESAHTLRRSDQKRVDEFKRVRNALAAGELPLTELEREVIIECA